MGWGGKEKKRGGKGQGFWVMYGKEQYTKYIVIKVNYNNVN